MYRYIIYTKPHIYAQHIVDKYKQHFNNKNCRIRCLDKHRIIVNLPEPLIIRSVYRRSHSRHDLKKIKEDHIVLDNGPPCSKAVQYILSDINVFTYLHPFIESNIYNQQFKPRFEPDISKPRLLQENCAKIDCPDFKYPKCKGHATLINGTGCCPFYVCDHTQYFRPNYIHTKEHFDTSNTHFIFFTILLLFVFKNIK